MRKPSADEAAKIREDLENYGFGTEPEILAIADRLDSLRCYRRHPIAVPHSNHFSNFSIVDDDADELIEVCTKYVEVYRNQIRSGSK